MATKGENCLFTAVALMLEIIKRDTFIPSCLAVVVQSSIPLLSLHLPLPCKWQVSL